MSNHKLRLAITIISILICITLLSACMNSTPVGNADLIEASLVKIAQPNYSLTQLQSKDIIESFSATGKLHFPVSDSLSFDLPGLFEACYVNPGDFVKQGDLLVSITFDQAEIREKTDVALINIELENRAFAASDAEHQKIYADLNNRRNMETDLIRQSIYDLLIEQAAGNRQRALDEHNMALQTLSDELKKYEEMARPAQLFAPYDGIVFGFSYKTEGEPISGGEPVIQIRDVSNFWIVISQSSGGLYYGMPVELEFGNIRMDGVVSSVPTGVGSGASGIWIKVDGIIDDPGSAIQKNFRVTAKSVAVSNAMTLPRAAVRDEDGKSYVMILDGGAAKKRYVKTGMTSFDTVQILDGLDSDDQVILN